MAPLALQSTTMSFANIRGLFPYFERHPDGAYLDSGASSLKLRSVVARLAEYLSYEHANIHRGAYALSANATELYDGAKQRLQRFFSAKSANDFVFTKGTTEAINLVAHAIKFNQGDVVLLSKLEHHSNIVPWQLLAERSGIRVEWVNITKNAELDYEDLSSKVKRFNPKLLAITALSNAFGSSTDLNSVHAALKGYDGLLLLDAAQIVSHKRISLDRVDFLVFSGHKIYGPTGIGVLYTSERAKPLLRPFLGGGDMIRSVTLTGSTYADYPERFEAGTPPIAEAISLVPALDFLEDVGLEAIDSYESELTLWGRSELAAVEGVTVYGPSNNSSIISFNLADVHPHDLATIADQFDVQIRAGHHCASVAMEAMGVSYTARASVGVYSRKEDFLRLVEACKHARKIFLG